MSYSFKLKSHPDKSLYEHLKNVGLASKRIVEEKKIENGEAYAKLAYLIGISHDFAKATTYFQKHLGEGIKTEKAYHSALSSVFGYYLCKREMPEINPNIEFIAWFVIKKHHSNISDLRGRDGELERLKDRKVEKNQIEDIKKNSLEELNTIYKELLPGIDIREFFEDFDDLCEEIYMEGERIALENKIDNYFLFLFFYSVLLDADKLDASGADFRELEKERKKWVQIPPNLVDGYKRSKFNKNSNDIVNKSRDEAYHEITEQIEEIDLKREKILSIELPTGCGKTLTALSFSLKLRERVKREMGFAPKIIYSLPFLSIIDQNAEVISELLAEYSGIAKWSEIAQMDEKTKKERLAEIPTSLLLKHHHLSDIRYREGENELDVEKSLLLIEGWHSEIVITTFVQFFHSLITNRNKAARKFHNMTNSIIILDEIQSIPYEYWSLVKEAIKCLADTYNCWVIFMTATMPLIFDPEEIRPLVNDTKRYSQRFNRLAYITEPNEETITEFQNELSNITFDKDTAIVVNTVASSKKIYHFLRDAIRSYYGEEPTLTKEGIAEFQGAILIDLSTHIIPKHREARISRVKKEENKREIVVTTQLIEAGVDIDMDLIFRDFAPFDSIIQSGGRCNRNGTKEKGCLKIVRLKDEKNRKFSNMIYDSTLTDITSEILNKDFEEKDIGKMIQKYFKKVKSRGANSKSEQNLECLKSLKFSGLRDFKLFDDDVPKVDAFVEIDGQAKDVWKKYEEINRIKDKFDRRKRFLEIKNKFYSNIISIPENEAKMFLVNEDLAYISKDNYDMETGFKGVSDDISCRII